MAVGKFDPDFFYSSKGVVASTTAAPPTGKYPKPPPIQDDADDDDEEEDSEEAEGDDDAGGFDEDEGELPDAPFYSREEGSVWFFIGYWMACGVGAHGEREEPHGAISVLPSEDLLPSEHGYKPSTLMRCKPNPYVELVVYRRNRSADPTCWRYLADGRRMPMEYLCALYIGSERHVVLVDELPNLLMLMREVGVSGMSAPRGHA